MKTSAIALSLFLAFFCASVFADRDDHERSRQAFQSGEILPLRTVLDKVETAHPGHILEIELERENRQWIYEVKMLQADGAVIKLDVDARTGNILKIKGK